MRRPGRGRRNDGPVPLPPGAGAGPKRPLPRGPAMSARTALRLARRELRGGLRGFRIFLACLVLGVAAIAAVGIVRASIQATRAGLPRPGLPVLLMHGVDDGLVPEAFSSGPYAAWVEASGGMIAYWRLHHVQHFDAFLGLPPLAARFLPLMPYAWAGMDAMWSHLEDGTPLPASRDIHPTPRGPGQPLDPAALDLP